MRQLLEVSMIDVAGLFNSILEFLRKPLDDLEHRIAEQYEYTEVEADLKKLMAEVKRAQTLDAADATRFWNNLEQLVGPLVLREQRITSEEVGRELRNSSNEMARIIQQCCHDDFEPHAPVPASLEAQMAQWQRNERNAARVLGEVATLFTTEGWEGQSASFYTQETYQHVAAVKELEGLMTSAAQSCRTGAVLNRAVFYVVAKQIRKTSNAIGGATNWGPAYRRSRTALRELSALLPELAAAKNGSVAAGSANTLSREMRQTVAMPNYLGGGQRGSNGFGTGPARTDQGVTADGSDANLRG